MITALLLFFLLANEAALVLPREPPECLQGPEFWCQDEATAARCSKLQFCLEHNWDELPEGVDEQHPLLKCKICTKVISLLKKLVPKTHNETRLTEALKKICSKNALKFIAKKCHQVVDRFVHPIEDGLVKNLEPREICVNIRMCSTEDHPGTLERFPVKVGCSRAFQPTLTPYGRFLASSRP